MTVSAVDLLAHRHHVPDGVLLDWPDLAQLVGTHGFVATDRLRQHWCCSQPTVSRRLRLLWEAGLLDYRPSRGGYRVRRVGPAENSKAPRW